jgi:hypothetical protein
MPSPNLRTEVVSIKVSVLTLDRLLQAMTRLGITSKTEAANRALAMWLDTVEAKGPGE